MAKFKSGDNAKILRFRNKIGDHIGFDSKTKIGDVVVLKEALYDSSLEFWSYEGGIQYIRADDLELIEDKSMPTPEYSCIRVTPPSKPKRYIVEGKHSLSNLAEFRIDRKYSDNTVNLSIDKGWNFDAESLREFATILNEIASVLEENSNA